MTHSPFSPQGREAVDSSPTGLADRPRPFFSAGAGFSRLVPCACGPP